MSLRLSDIKEQIEGSNMQSVALGSGVRARKNHVYYDDGFKNWLGARVPIIFMSRDSNYLLIKTPSEIGLIPYEIRGGQHDGLFPDGLLPEGLLPEYVSLDFSKFVVFEKKNLE